MTDDVRDRILALLHAGPATVAGLAARLGLPGGVVSYHLKMLEQGGQARVGAIRSEGGVPVPRWVSTASAARPPFLVPAPLPGLTWTGTGRFPVPVWTTATEETVTSGSAPAAVEPAAMASPAVSEAPAPGAPAADAPGSVAPAPGAPAGPGDRPELPVPRQARRNPAGARLAEARRVPMDEATFYEFAARLDTLTREFAARSTPGAPPAELTVVLYRPDGDAAAGHGS